MITLCYSGVVKGRLGRLVCFGLIALLSGSPAVAAAVCAELCGLKTASTPTSPHCSKHAAAHPADIGEPSAPAHEALPAGSPHGVWHHGDGESVAVAVGGPACCGHANLPAMAAKVTRPENGSNSVMAVAPHRLMPMRRASLRVCPPGPSRSPALSRAPLVLRI